MNAIRPLNQMQSLEYTSPSRATPLKSLTAIVKIALKVVAEQKTERKRQCLPERDARYHAQLNTKIVRFILNQARCEAERNAIPKNSTSIRHSSGDLDERYCKNCSTFYGKVKFSALLTQTGPLHSLCKDFCVFRRWNRSSSVPLRASRIPS